MLQALANVFKIPELRNKILFTLGMLAVYRIGFWIPIPGVNQEQLAEFMRASATGSSALGRMFQFVQVFTGGSLSQSTVFALGIMPYISASIIFQILASAYEPLKKLQQEGPSGRQKIMEWTRYATVALCIIQAFAVLMFLRQNGLVFVNWAGNPVWWVMAVAAMTASCVFLMWLGEQIDKYGIGNGVSLIITAGILTGMPGAIFWVIQNSPMKNWGWASSMFGLETGGDSALTWMGVIILGAAFVFVVAGAVLITVAQRRIPVQQAKHTRGRKVFGGQRSYLPLRVNHGGVMPIIFASSLMIIPSVALGQLGTAVGGSTGFFADAGRFLADAFGQGEYLYELCFILLIFFFSYFWTTVQFNPEEMSKQLRDHGSFIPGLRPGPRTAEYLETVLERITYVGAAFLAVIAVVPAVVSNAMQIPFYVTQFLGGTGLLICVSVGLDLVQRIEANLLMRNYAGFLGGDDGRGPKVRGPRSM